MILYWNLSGVFFLIRPELWVWGSTCIKCAYINMIYLAEGVFVRFLLTVVTLFFFSFSYCTLSKAVTMYSPHQRRGELCPSSLRVEYLHELFWILLSRRFVSFTVNLFTHLFISVWTDRSVFYILCYFCTNLI